MRRQGKKEEESLDGWGSCPFTLIADALAVSDAEEINMSLIICTPIHLPRQHAARLCTCVQPQATTSSAAAMQPTFYKLLSAVTQNTNFIAAATADTSVLSETSDEDFSE